MNSGSEFCISIDLTLPAAATKTRQSYARPGLMALSNNTDMGLTVTSRDTENIAPPAGKAAPGCEYRHGGGVIHSGS